MSLSTLSKINLAFLLLTGCCCPYKGTIEIPTHWHSCLDLCTYERPPCFLWWEIFGDPVLTFLIEQAECYHHDHSMAGEVGRNYFELRGLQAKRQLLQENLKVQKGILSLTEGLTTLSEIEQNQIKPHLTTLDTQDAQFALEIDKTIFHLSTLAGYTPDALFDSLLPPSPLPELPACLPLASPCEVIASNRETEEARRIYGQKQDRLTFYNYENKVLHLLEEKETAIASLHYQLQQLAHFNTNKEIKVKSYQLTRDLYHQGIVDERVLAAALMEVFAAESTLIELKTKLLQTFVTLYHSDN